MNGSDTSRVAARFVRVPSPSLVTVAYNSMISPHSAMPLLLPLLSLPVPSCAGPSTTRNESNDTTPGIEPSGCSAATRWGYGLVFVPSGRWSSKWTCADVLSALPESPTHAIHSPASTWTPDVMPGANPHPRPSSVPGVSLLRWMYHVAQPSSCSRAIAQQSPPWVSSIHPTVPSAAANTSVIFGAKMSVPS